MSSTIELAERKSTARVMAYLLFAVLIVALLLASFGAGGTDFFRGMWTGLSMVTLLYMLPFGRWLKPRSALTLLLDDESVRDHRRTSAAAGFWAAMASAFGLTIATAEGDAVSSFDVARVIVTAAMVAALVGFAILEMRAARG